MSLALSLLDEGLIRYRRADGSSVAGSLPAVLAALANDDIYDFPALRAHQRHPWHAFLVQLAAIALHHEDVSVPFPDSESWRATLLKIAPDSAWHLVAPAYQPALLQAPVTSGDTATWKNVSYAADEIDMLVTSKNHDLKAARATRSQPDDWLFALVSLQTQEGFLGAGNYGISRMNGGFASRPGVGFAPPGLLGARWSRDIAALLGERSKLLEAGAMSATGGIALVGLCPWDGATSLAFTSLDPFYIEICRRIRLCLDEQGRLFVVATGSKVARIEAKALNGVTGDAWTPVDAEANKALTITAAGFHYRLVTELLLGQRYLAPVALQSLKTVAGGSQVLIAQGVVRGQGKTEGYHERRVPVPAKVLRKFGTPQHATLEILARERIDAIGGVRGALWSALTTWFSNGEGKDPSDPVKKRATEFARPFEAGEDTRFFDDLFLEVDANDAQAIRLDWERALVARAETVLRSACDEGPQTVVRRYVAKASALSRFHGILRGSKSPVPRLMDHWRQQAAETRS